MRSQIDILEAPDSPQPDPEWLRGRVHEWESAHLISHEQAAAILDLEASRAGPADQSLRYRRLIAIVSTFGGILLGVGLLLLIGSNWADLPRVTKVLMAIAGVVTLEGVGYGLRFHTPYHRTGSTFLFIGSAAYGGAIFLIAQAYNHSLDDPNLFLLWFAPVIPTAYVLRSHMIAALGIAVGYGALGFRAADWLDAAGGGLEDYGWQTLYVVVGVAVAAVGYLHHRSEAMRLMGRPYQWIGSLTVLVLLYVMSFENWFEDGIDGWVGDVPGGMWLALGVAVAVTVAAVVALATDGSDSARPALAGLAVPAAAGYLLIGILLLGSASTTLSFVLANVVLFASLIGFVGVGILTRQEALVNLSLAFFGLAVASRYLEIGGGMFGTAVSMMLGGVLLIGLAWGLERLRRSLLARFELGGGP